MKRYLLACLLALALIPALPAPAHADCASDAVGDCGDDFGDSSEKFAGILGWCYLIRLAWCGLEAFAPAQDAAPFDGGALVGPDRPAVG